MRLLVTGGAGVLGRAFLPLARDARHQVNAPGRAGLDLFDPAAVAAVMPGVDAVLHLATRIQALDKLGQPEAWRENDRLRAEASAILVDATGNGSATAASPRSPAGGRCASSYDGVRAATRDRWRRRSCGLPMGEPATEAATSERDVLLATKLNVPGLRPDLVPRPRLAQRLDCASRAGGAGAGAAGAGRDPAGTA